MIAAIYARKSTEQNTTADEQKSIARQLDHARAYASRRGWTVDEDQIYIDDGVSGAEFAARPGFVRLMNALRRPKFQALVMSEESRLGRESIETAYALKQIIAAGVRVFFYLEDRERTLDSPTDKIMLSLTAFADELERERARQRTYDAMIRKARAGHVTGGGCFGYRNVGVADADGNRSHVDRVIEPDQADIVREIFEHSAAGWGLKRIAKHLNDRRAVAPRSQLGRPRAWAPSTIRAVLHNPIYRGEIVWNRTRKRNRWGQHRQTDRASAEWVRVPAPALRIVTDRLWRKAHDRLTSARRLYFTNTLERRGGRPASGTPSPYLLTSLAVCGQCGAPLRSRTRRHRYFLAYYYGCANYHERGTALCTNSADVPMAAANRAVLSTLLDTVLDNKLVTEIIDKAVRTLTIDDAPERRRRLENERAGLTREIDRLTDALAAGGNLPSLLEALQQRERARRAITGDLEALTQAGGLLGAGELRAQLTAIVAEWRRVLAEETIQARPIVAALLAERVTFTPLTNPKRWRVSGKATLSGLFERECLPVNGTSPGGFDPFRYPFDVIIDQPQRRPPQPPPH